MSSSGIMNSVNQILFKLFLVLLLFVYYETRVVPGTLHTWVMIIGIVLLMPALIKKYLIGAVSLPLDYFLIGILALLVLIGFVSNFGSASADNLQAYILMLVTYVYAKESTSDDTLEFLYAIAKWFVLINGILIVIQFFTGGYFPARLLAAGNPPLEIASGVSDGPTKTGMLIAFSLSILFVQFIYRGYKFTLIDFFILFLGVISLALASSRAGLLSFIGVVFITVLYGIYKSSMSSNFRINKFVVIACVLFVVSSIYVLFYGQGLEYLFLLDAFSSSERAVDVLIYKLDNMMDSSTLERFNTVNYFIGMVKESPWVLLSVGFGVGGFEASYGLNIHNSWAEVLATTGVYGFLAFTLLIVYVFHLALSSSRVLQILPLLAAIVSVMIFMLAHDVLRGRLFWTAFGILAGWIAVHSKSFSNNAGLNEDPSYNH